MAFSYVLYTANGTNRNFSFSFPYLDTKHIKVSIDGVETSDFTFLNSNTIQLNTAPAGGSVVKVFRKTPQASVPVDFTDGSILLERDLDLMATFNLYVGQEATDAAEASIYLNALGKWEGKNLRLTHLADPEDPTDAATKRWVEARTAADVAATSASATASANSAAASQSSANSAASSARVASTKAAEASTSATNAANSAAAASTSASIASGKASAAATSASNAAASATAAAAAATNAANASRLTVGTVTTGAAGSSASVTITGAAGSQVLNITIPRGDTGLQGPQGPKGETGPQGPQGPAGTGTGDVLGPGAAVTTNALVQWSDTTGTRVKAAGLSGLVKLTSGVPSAAVAGKDYVVPSGSITGNSATATKLQTASRINGTSFDGSADITTANWGTARTITIGNTGKSFDGSGNVSWSLWEILGGGVPGTALEIAGWGDLNTLQTPGFYLQPLNVNAANGANYPIALAGALVVLKNATGVSQLYYTYGSASLAPRVFFRAVYDGSWSPWWETYHSGNIDSALKGANQSLSAYGYQKLSGGLIFQWGTAAPGYSSVVNLPIAFPNAALQAVAVSSATGSNSHAVVRDLTSTQITLANNNNGGTIRWLAWGF